MNTTHLHYSGFADNLPSCYGKKGNGLPMPDSIVQMCGVHLVMASPVENEGTLPPEESQLCKGQLKLYHLLFFFLIELI